MVEEGSLDCSPARSRQEEDSSSRATMDVSSPASDRGKTIAEHGAELGSNINLDYLRTINEGLTQLKVRLEGGSRTITIPIYRDFLFNTEEVVHVLSILCSDVEGETLKMITDSTLSKSIAGLTLRVSMTAIYPFPNALAYF